MTDSLVGLELGFQMLASTENESVCAVTLYRLNVTQSKSLDSTILNDKCFKNFTHDVKLLTRTFQEKRRITVYTSMDLTDGDILNALQCFVTHFNIKFPSILKCSVT